MADTEGFEEFVAIVDEGSVSAAARVLGVPRATLSRRLAALEDDLGVRLIHRSTRSMTLTRAGATLYRRARRVVDEARAARAEVTRLDETPRGLLRVSLPTGQDDSLFMGRMISEFARTYPDVILEVLSTARFVDLVAENVDVALRGGVPREDGYISRILWRNHTGAVATPELLAEVGTPTTREELSKMPCLVGFGGDTTPQRAWPLLDGGTVRVRRAMAANGLAMQRYLVLQGHGVGLLPLEVVHDDLRAGRLVRVLPDEVGARSMLRLVYVERAFLDPKVKAFLDHATAFFKTHEPLELMGRV